MKTNGPFRSATQDPSVIRGRDYLTLTKAEQSNYHPIDPKYERLPIYSKVFFALTVLSLFLYVIMINSKTFSDLFNKHISMHLRFLFSHLTSWIPFSLGEFIIWMIPLGVVLILRHALKKRCDSWKCVAVFVGIILSFAGLFFSIFVLNFASGYRGSTIDKKMQLDRTNIQAEELYSVAEDLVENINIINSEITFSNSGFSVMPYNLEQMNRHLIKAYDKLADKYDFIDNTYTRVKPVMLSEVMSYMHITGVYSFFTGEANINVGFPDYAVVFTAAHELAHQRGIAREDEANFIAFLACTISDDPYIQYCGYVNMYEYIASALARTDPELYLRSYNSINIDVQKELLAYNDFYDKYRNSAVSEVSEGINNSFLQSQGTAGTVSYNMVVELGIGYHRKHSPDN